MAVVSTQSDTLKTRAAGAGRGIDAVLARVGRGLRDHQLAIRRLQWGVVGVYVFLVAVPAFLPMPRHAAHVWTNLVLFAQFVFWGVWWPFVLLSMVLVGRLWCGLLCPEGALSERVAEHGRGGAMPHWLQWKGWPFLAFVLTTVYGQMTSVYQYPGPALVVLGGSTLAAMAVRLSLGPQQAGVVPLPLPGHGVFDLLANWRRWFPC